MDWDMLLVTGALFGVLMLMVILGRIWQDQGSRRPSDAPPEKRAASLAQGGLENVTRPEDLVA